jgi:hypothetical protein
VSVARCCSAKAFSWLSQPRAAVSRRARARELLLVVVTADGMAG